MSNYIKIPLAANPGRAFRSTSITISGAGVITSVDPANPAVVSGGDAGGNSASAAADEGGATFTGATGTAGTPAGGLDDLTLTVATLGNNYKVGDVVSIAASTSGTETVWSQPIKFTVTEAMLAVLDPLAGQNQMIPIDDIISVESVSASGSLVDNKLFISTKIPSGATSASNTHIEFAGWTVEFEDEDYNQANCIASISEGIAKAASAINSQPEVVWFGGAEVKSIAFGKNPTTV